jgi:hypothetical protein
MRWNNLSVGLAVARMCRRSTQITGNPASAKAP